MLKEYRSNFDQFCAPYLKQDDTDAYALKYQHSIKVCENATIIASYLTTDKIIIKLSQIAALLHDIGRFPQFDKYKTFNDKLSEDHAELSVQTIIQDNILKSLNKNEQHTILTAIKLHNKFSIEKEQLDNAEEMIARILRDADKLDIFRIMTDNEIYGKTGSVTNLLNQSNEPVYSESIKKSIRNSELASFDNIKTTCDFRLLQLSWIFDVNYPITLEIINQNHYIQKLIEQLPNKKSISTEINLINAKIKNYAIQ